MEGPYPMVPSKKDKDRHLARFLDIFRKLEITMTFVEALQQMTLYSKFLKDMLTRKHKYIHQENIVVEGNCSAAIQKILSLKHKDPRSVTIPCSIGEVTVGEALIDLGASINLMPLSMCRRLGELEIMPTKMTIQLPDCWISPVVTFWSNFSLYKYVQGKSNSLESAPDRQVFKIKTDESEYRTQGTSI